VLLRVGAVQLHVGGLDRELAAPRHGVARVDRQVHDHLVELAGVAHHAADGPEHDAELHVLADEPREHLLHVPDHHAQGEHLAACRVLAAEREELAREGGRALGGALDQLDGLAHAIVDLPQQELAAAQDDREQIVEVVGDAAREAADRLHLLGLAELALEGAVLGDVGEHAQRAHDDARGIAQQRQ
jgi:hypothetical protein